MNKGRASGRLQNGGRDNQEPWDASSLGPVGQSIMGMIYARDEGNSEPQRRPEEINRNQEFLEDCKRLWSQRPEESNGSEKIFDDRRRPEEINRNQEFLEDCRRLWSQRPEEPNGSEKIFDDRRIPEEVRPDPPHSDTMDLRSRLLNNAPKTPGMVSGSEQASNSVASSDMIVINKGDLQRTVASMFEAMMEKTNAAKQPAPDTVVMRKDDLQKTVADMFVAYQKGEVNGQGEGEARGRWRDVDVGRRDSSPFRSRSPLFERCDSSSMGSRPPLLDSPVQVSREYDEMTRGYGEMNRGYGEMSRGYGEMSRGYGEMNRGYGEISWNDRSPDNLQNDRESGCNCELSNFNQINQLKCRVCYPQTARPGTQPSRPALLPTPPPQNYMQQTSDRPEHESGCNCELSNFNQINNLKCIVCYPQTAWPGTQPSRPALLPTPPPQNYMQETSNRPEHEYAQRRETAVRPRGGGDSSKRKTVDVHETGNKKPKNAFSIPLTRCPSCAEKHKNLPMLSKHFSFKHGTELPSTEEMTENFTVIAGRAICNQCDVDCNGWLPHMKKFHLLQHRKGIAKEPTESIDASYKKQKNVAVAPKSCPSSCPSCDEKFPNLPQLSKHFYVQHAAELPSTEEMTGNYRMVTGKGRRVQCNQCGEDCTGWLPHMKKYHLFQHRKGIVKEPTLPTESTDASYECPCCKKSFTKEKDLSFHFAFEHRELLPSTEVARASFKYNKVGRYNSCMYCGYSDETSLPAHMKFHLYDKHQDVLQMPTVVKEKQDADEILSCESCEQTFPTVPQLSKHFSLFHTSQLPSTEQMDVSFPVVDGRAGCKHCNVACYSWLPHMKKYHLYTQHSDVLQNLQGAGSGNKATRAQEKKPQGGQDTKGFQDFLSSLNNVGRREERPQEDEDKQGTKSPESTATEINRRLSSEANKEVPKNDPRRAVGAGECPCCGVHLVDIQNMIFHMNTLHPDHIPSDEVLDNCFTLLDGGKCFSLKGGKKNKCIFCPYKMVSRDNERRLKIHLLREHKQEIMEKGYTEPEQLFEKLPDDALGFIMEYCQKNKVGEIFKMVETPKDKTLMAELQIPGVDFIAKGEKGAKGENKQYHARLQAAEKMKDHLLHLEKGRGSWRNS